MVAIPDDLAGQLATAVVVADADLTVRYLNPAAESLLGLSARATVGQSAAALFAGSDLPARLDSVLADGRSFTAREWPVTLAGGSRSLTVDLTATPVGDPPAQVVIELTALDRHLRISSEERMVAQRAASRSLVRGLAHEIKNPLGGLRGAAQLLERELGDEGLREYTRVIISEADRLTALVDTMLGPTRTPTRTPTNIHEVTDRVTKLLRTEFPTGVEVARDYDPSIPELDVDADQLVQALLNLARNGAQAMAGKGALTLRTRIERQVTIAGVPHRQVACIDIADTGPGIDADMRDQIFFPLVTTRADGNGLGLPIAQALVAGQDGMITCTSEPGATVFTVRLPMQGAG